MAYTIWYPLKHNENVQKIEIDDISLLRSVGAIVQDDTIERRVAVPLSNEIDVVAKMIVLYFDHIKITTRRCEKQTFTKDGTIMHVGVASPMRS